MTNFSHNFAGSGAIRADSIDVTGTVTATSFVGALTGDTTGTHTGTVTTSDLTMDNVKFVTPPPNTSAELVAATGLTSVAGWRLDQVGVAGNVTSFGNLAGTIATAGTPTFGHPLAKSDGSTLRSMYFDGLTGDACSANVLDPASSSFIAGGRFALVADPGGTAHTLMGRFKAGVSNLGWGVRATDAGDIVVFIGDASAVDFSFTLASAVLTIGAPPVEVVVQLDRSGAQPILRARYSRDGVTLGSNSVTCTALGTLTSASQEFGFGAIPSAAPAYNGGAAAQWAFFASGTQAEGASKAQTVAQGLGWEQ
jgi:hypothetical protein